MRCLFIAALLLPGCTWISQKDLDCSLQLVDDDQDGYALNEADPEATGNPCDHLVAVDCNDADPAIKPTADEIWYDGVDQNCADFGENGVVVENDFDHDADGFLAVGYETAAVDMYGNGVTWSEGDCKDDDSSYYPGATDAWYDGRDQNCDGLDDYDSDGDFFVAWEHEGLRTDLVSDSGTLPGGDCDDSAEGISPVAQDPWYSGIDENCDGRDDYDQDLDAYYPDGVAYGPTTYAPGSGNLQPGDCVDTDASIHPLATDSWYDGVDSDCVQDDDYDADRDGFASLAQGMGPDCLDTNPRVYPGAEEQLEDSLDGDCDGGDDSFLLTDLDDTWTNIHDVAIEQNEGNFDLFLLATADQVREGAGSPFDQTGYAVVYDAGSLGDGRTGAFSWLDASPQITPGLDGWATDTALYQVGGLTTGASRTLALRKYPFSKPLPVQANSTFPGATFDDLSVAQDAAGLIHAVGCTREVDPMAYLAVGESGGSFHRYVEIPEDIFGGPCELEFFRSDGQATLLLNETSVGLAAYTFQPCDSDTCVMDFGASQDFSAWSPSAIDVVQGAHDPWVVVTDTSAALIDVLVLAERSAPVAPDYYSLTAVQTLTFSSQDPPIQADAIEAPDGRIYIAWVTREGRVGLTWGEVQPSANLLEIELPVDFVPEHVAVHVVSDGSSVVVAVSGTDAAAPSGSRLVMGYAAL